ncbi:MAG: hypothetical protein RL095_2748 [Verrucomicrobiota bacterium]|jgi:hypothetical protein
MNESIEDRARRIVLSGFLERLLSPVRRVRIKDPPPTDVFVLDRYCGREIYPLEEATCNVRFERNTEWPLRIEVKAGEATVQCEDTKTLFASPYWSIEMRARDLTDLKMGTTLKLPVDSSRNPSVIHNFYYCSHTEPEKTKVEVLEVERDRMRLRLTGRVTDVNYYDGSKPDTKLYVEAWFHTGDEPLPKKICANKASVVSPESSQRIKALVKKKSAPDSP